jgi:hypothetical protein
LKKKSRRRTIGEPPLSAVAGNSFLNVRLTSSFVDFHCDPDIKNLQKVCLMVRFEMHGIDKSLHPLLPHIAKWQNVSVQPTEYTPEILSQRSVQNIPAGLRDEDGIGTPTSSA